MTKEKSPLTTLCYIEQDGKYLMLHRIKKEHDINEGKWIGVGGHFEAGESPEECLLREVQEETGLRLVSWRFRGIVTFTADDVPTEYMCLYTADSYMGELNMDCGEGVLRWVPKEEVMNLPLWEGDRVFLELLAKDAQFFSLQLSYVQDKLVECVLDGRKRL
ncbi:MAG: 8-oxo-dGTP diphosphatase [Lachnospiraceae bacterium]|nr:8-oxo-dGTP diphosphatase [Lachnospiraceae bacterium]